MDQREKLGQTIIDIFAICGVDEETTGKLLGIMSETLQKENEEMEIQNEAYLLAGHNKELQQNIILLMKEYGLAGGEAYELINRLSNVGNTEKLKASMPMDEAVQESGTCEEPSSIADVMQCVYTSGEDPGDAQEPSKGSGTIDYDGLISAVAGHLDVNDWSEFNRLIKEHKELTSEKVVPVETLPKYKPKPFNIYADGQTPELVETAYEAREAQIVKFANKDIVIHTKEETLCTLSIEEMLEKCYLMSIGNKLKLDDRVYVIELVGATSGIDQVVYVQVKEVKRYE